MPKKRALRTSSDFATTDVALTAPERTNSSGGLNRHGASIINDLDNEVCTRTWLCSYATRLMLPSTRRDCHSTTRDCAGSVPTAYCHVCTSNPFGTIVTFPPSDSSSNTGSVSRKKVTLPPYDRYSTATKVYRISVHSVYLTRFETGRSRLTCARENDGALPFLTIVPVLNLNDSNGGADTGTT